MIWMGFGAAFEDKNEADLFFKKKKKKIGTVRVFKEGCFGDIRIGQQLFSVGTSPLTAPHGHLIVSIIILGPP